MSDGRRDTTKELFEQFAMPHFESLYGFAMSLAHDTAQADDLVQGTYLAAYRRFDSFEVGTNCKAWLFKICKNRFIDEFREQRRRPIHQEIELVEPPTYDDGTDVRAFENHGIENEEIFLDLFGDEINRFLLELPEEFRRAVVLCDVEGFSYQEIGELMDTPIGTVRSRISRARNFLRGRLESYARELGYLDESRPG